MKPIAAPYHVFSVLIFAFSALLGWGAGRVIGTKNADDYVFVALVVGVFMGINGSRVFGRLLGRIEVADDALRLSGPFRTVVVRLEDVVSVSSLFLRGGLVSMALDVREDDGIAGYIAPGIDRAEVDSFVSIVASKSTANPKRRWSLRYASFWRSIAIYAVTQGAAFGIGLCIGGRAAAVPGALLAAAASTLTSVIARLLSRNRLRHPRQQ